MPWSWSEISSHCSGAWSLHCDPCDSETRHVKALCAKDVARNARKRALKRAPLKAWSLRRSRLRRRRRPSRKAPARSYRRQRICGAENLPHTATKVRIEAGGAQNSSKALKNIYENQVQSAQCFRRRGRFDVAKACDRLNVKLNARTLRGLNRFREGLRTRTAHAIHYL